MTSLQPLGSEVTLTNKWAAKRDWMLKICILRNFGTTNVLEYFLNFEYFVRWHNFVTTPGVKCTPNQLLNNRDMELQGPLSRCVSMKTCWEQHGVVWTIWGDTEWSLKIDQCIKLLIEFLRGGCMIIFTWWVHDRLGKGVRKAVSSCAVWLIHDPYPVEMDLHTIPGSKRRNYCIITPTIIF